MSGPIVIGLFCESLSLQCVLFCSHLYAGSTLKGGMISPASAHIASTQAMELTEQSEEALGDF